MIGRKLYEDPDFLLYVGMFGSRFRIRNKHNGRTVTIPKYERTYISETLAAAERLGVPIEPGNEVLRYFFRTIVEIVLSPGGDLWIAFFSVTPWQQGINLLGIYNRFQAGEPLEGWSR